MIGTLRCLLACLVVAPHVAAAAPFSWRIVTPVSEGAVAVAYDGPTGRIAVGDVRGLALGVPGEALRRVPLHGPVRDVAFAGGAASWLFAATDAGLFRVDPAGEVRSVAPAPGHAARDVVRIASAAGAVAVASADGVFVSRDGVAWQRASSRWPSGAASAVALRAVAGGFECWAVVEARVWAVALDAGPRGLAPRAARPLILPEAPTGNGPVDVAFDVGGSDALVLYARALALRMPRSSEWRIVRPTLAPGAVIARAASGFGAVWLATDRGLWSAPRLDERWARAASPVGHEPVGDLVAAGGQLFVASDAAVRQARAWGVQPSSSPRLAARGEAALPQAPPALPPRVRAAPNAPPERVDPPIEALHRAVLAYSDLAPSQIRSLRVGVAERGWLPDVALRVGGGGDRDRDEDYDQAFVSGDTRHLFDRTRRRGYGFDASVTLSWDLGDIRYHPEAIDVSREAREVLKLRDDVLDEVNQLYFERRALLARLASDAVSLEPAEVLRMRLRAAELAAGLDAWSGGWFRRAQRPRSP